MCRMLLFNGKDEKYFQSFLKSLEDVSKQDPLHNLEKKAFLDHKDGWGYVDSGSDFISLNKSLQPIFDDYKKNFVGDMRMIHSRNATEGEPHGILSTQPFHMAFLNDDIFFAHNGWIDKVKISKGIGEEFIHSRSDSEVFLNLMAGLEGPILQKFLTALEVVYETDSLLSALNIFILSVNRKTKQRDLLVYSDAKHFNLYHKLFFLRGTDFSAVISSSLLESRFFPKGIKIEPLSPGIVYSVYKDRFMAMARVKGCNNAPPYEAIP